MINKEKVLILGEGFLGKEFLRQGYRYHTTRNREHVDDNTFYLNVDSDLLSVHLERIFDKIHFDTIINCIGIADTRYCEKRENFQEIVRVNGNFVEFLSRWCKEFNVKLVHISTGCLYAKRTGTVSETDFIEAHCNYVVSKWIGEMGCDLERDLIIRPRLYFSSVENKLNLICKLPKFKTILNEFNSVTSTRTIAEAVAALLKNKQVGVFNVANDGAYTIKQLSEAIGYKWTKEQVVTQDELHKSQGLYLVNNVMDLSKLKQFYIPRDAIVEFKWCKEHLHV